MVEEKPTGNGRHNRFRQDMDRKIGFGHCRGRKSVLSLDATPIFGEQPFEQSVVLEDELSTVLESESWRGIQEMRFFQDTKNCS